MLDRMELGRKLTMLRSNSNLSQKQVANYLDMDQSLLSKIESGERSIGITALEKLASLYCLSLDELCGEEKSSEFMQLAFRATKLTNEDLFHLAEINRIIINQRYMDKVKRSMMVDD